MASSTTKQWADRPFQLLVTTSHANEIDEKTADRYTKASGEMVVVHNIIIRGLNSIYLQAPHVKPEDHDNFIGYYGCKRTPARGIFIRRQGLSNIPPGRKSSPATFSGSRLCEIIDAFAPILLTHLSEEIPTLLSLSKFGDKIDMDKIWEKDGKTAVGMSDKTAGLVFFFLNCDTTFEGGKWAAFPPIPRPIGWVFTHICTWPNRAYWKFASCDYSGKLQDLYAE